MSGSPCKHLLTKAKRDIWRDDGVGSRHLLHLPVSLVCACLSLLNIVELVRALKTCRLLNSVGRSSAVSNNGFVQLRNGLFPRGRRPTMEIPLLIKAMRLRRLDLYDLRVPLDRFAAPDVGWRDTLQDLTLAPYWCSAPSADGPGLESAHAPGYACLNALTALRVLRIRSGLGQQYLLRADHLERMVATVRLPSLTYLDLRGAACSSFVSLTALPHLTVLDVTDYCPLYSASVAATLPSLPGLRALRIDDFTKDYPATLPSMPLLTELHVSPSEDRYNVYLRTGRRPQTNLADMLLVACPKLLHLSVAGFEWMTLADLRHLLDTLAPLVHLRLPYNSVPPLSGPRHMTFAVAELRLYVPRFVGHKYAPLTAALLHDWQRHRVSHITFPTLFVE